MANLITPEEAAGYLGISEASAPNQTLIDTAESLALAYIGRPMDNVQRTEFYSIAPGQKLLRLRVWPVTEVISVLVDPNYNFGQNTTVTPLELTAGEDYAIVYDDEDISKAGILEYYGSANGGYGWTFPRAPFIGYGLSPAARSWNFGWPVGQGNVRVRYKGGYDPMPEDYKIAVAYQARWLQLNGSQAGVYTVSESLGQNSYTRAGIDQVPGMKIAGAAGILLPMVAQMLAKYRDVTIGGYL